VIKQIFAKRRQFQRRVARRLERQLKAKRFIEEKKKFLKNQ
jgi:hypothetical protein